MASKAIVEQRARVRRAPVTCILHGPGRQRAQRPWRRLQSDSRCRQAAYHELLKQTNQSAKEAGMTQHQETRMKGAIPDPAVADPSKDLVSTEGQAMQSGSQQSGQQQGGQQSAQGNQQAGQQGNQQQGRQASGGQPAQNASQSQSFNRQNSKAGKLRGI
ncbi:hypothetical protein [Massilia consociata]|uniref:Uncharacterized protein n=1 Tax=Massilia consociata TaxID=760117 RepID=A0ABV6FAI7_9BURK